MTTWDEARAANLANWNERAAIHATSATYDLDGLAGDPQRLSGVVAFDATRLTDVAGRRLLHLQCHIGTDTVSWARLGAEVTGLDFSEPALATARDLAERSGVRARFVQADLYDAAEALEGENFDIVYTGVGALNWLADVPRWARLVATLLAPGGRLYLRECHPMLATLSDTSGPGEFVVEYPYFFTPEPLSWDEDTTYTGDETKLVNTRNYEWQHPLAEVVQALLDAGLALRSLEEHRFLEWPFWPWMEPAERGTFVLPAPLRDQVPLMYSLLASKNG